MTDLIQIAGPVNFGLAVLVTFAAGIVKGTIGFALPMLMISGLSSFLAPELALAALIVPTLVTNIWQAMRQGLREAWRSVSAFRVFLLCGLVTLILGAQLVQVLPRDVIFLVIGVPVAVFAVLQLSGWQLRMLRRRTSVEALFGGLAGFLGGLVGVWGPPTVAYLTAINTPKKEQMRLQGAIYGLGALALSGAHVQSGVLRAETLPLSLMMVFPAIAGMLLGLRIQDRIDQAAFRKVTLLVLLLAGLNLVRRGLFG